MLEETFLELQQSEGIVCNMASRLLAAYIASGQLNATNEEELIERSISLAVRIVHKADRMIESDNEKGQL